MVLTATPWSRAFCASGMPASEARNALATVSADRTWGTRRTLVPPTDIGAGCGIRTHKPFRAVVFETTAYAVPPTRPSRAYATGSDFRHTPWLMSTEPLHFNHES